MKLSPSVFYYFWDAYRFYITAALMCMLHLTSVHGNGRADLICYQRFLSVSDPSIKIWCTVKLYLCLLLSYSHLQPSGVLWPSGGNPTSLGQQETAPWILHCVGWWAPSLHGQVFPVSFDELFKAHYVFGISYDQAIHIFADHHLQHWCKLVAMYTFSCWSSCSVIVSLSKQYFLSVYFAH